MGKVFRVDPDKLKEASKQLQNLSDSYTQIYTQLLQQASEMGAAWEGPDNLAFVQQINGFLEELQAMAKKLSLASQTLEAQGSNYATRCDDNITQVQKLVN